MKSINIFLFEKLSFNKSTQADVTLIELSQDNKVLDDIRANNIKVLVIPYAKTFGEDARDKDKMREYKAKNSKPERLVNSIKDNTKLLRRFKIAVNMKWIDCIEVFGNAIIERGIGTKEQVILYLAQNYKQ